MKKGLKFLVGFLSILLLTATGWAQTSGDFRSNSATLNWSNAGGWQRFTAGSWQATAEYPGQSSGTNTVTIQTGHTVTLDVVPANSMLSLVVTGQLDMGANSLTLSDGVSGTGTLTISTGSLTTGNVTSANGDITVSTLTATGAANIYVTDSWTVSAFTAGTSTVHLTGGTGNDISGSPTFYNLTIASSETGGVTLNSPISIANGGSFTHSAAGSTFNPNGNTVTGVGTNTFTMSTGGLTVTNTFAFDTQYIGFESVTVSGGTITYTGTSQNVTGMSYFNLTLNGGTKTATGNVDVNGALNVQAGQTFNLQTNDLNVAASITLNTTGTLSATGGTVTLDGNDVNQNLNAGVYTLNNLTIAPPSITANRTYTISSSLTLTGNFLGSNPAGSPTVSVLIALGNNTITSSNGTGTFGLAEYVRLTTTNADISTFIDTFGALSDGFTTGSFSPSSWIYFQSTSAQTIPVLADGNYGSIYLGDGGNGGNSVKTLDGDVVVNGAIAMSNAGAPNQTTFDVQGFNVTVGGNFTKQANAILTMTAGATLSLAGSSQILTLSGSPTIQNIEFLGATTTNIVAGANFTVAGDFVAVSGTTITMTSNVSLLFTGTNWDVDGLFQPSTGTVNFSGTGTQNIDMPSTGFDIDGYFNNLTISNTTVGGVVLLSDAEVQQDFTLAANAVFDISNRTFYIGDDWVRNTGATINTTNSTVVFDGGAQQDITSGGVAFNNIIFRNAGEKRPAAANAIVANNDISIEGGAILNNANGVSISLAGDWTNFGTFTTGGSTVTFNGTNQELGGLFYSVTLSGSGTKTLNSQLDVDGLLTVNSGVTLDVSASNYTIALNGSIGGNEWGFAAGSGFTPRSGLVTFTGGAKNMVTQGLPLWDLTLNMTAGSDLDVVGVLDINNDLTVQNGDLDLQTNALNVAGDVDVQTSNGGTIIFTGGTGPVTLDATAGSINVNFGTTAFTANLVVGGPGVTYTLLGSLNSTYNAASNGFTLNSGTFVVDGVTVTMTDATNAIVLNGGVFHVSEDGILTMPDDGEVVNQGGTFRVVGTDGFPATVNGNVVGGGVDGYQIINTSGTIEAAYFQFSQLTNGGINFNGGSVDATNSFNNGSFSDHRGATATDAFLTITADPGAAVNSSEVTFTNATSAANFNVRRTDNGANVWTFVDANGAFAGETFDTETGSGQVNWSFPGGVTWTGNVDVDGSPGDGSSWNDSNNWSTNSVPGATDYVILDHSTVVGTYSVSITGSDATSGNMSISSPSNNITLTVGSGRTLDINGDLDFGTNTTITMTDATSLLTVSGSWGQTTGATFNDGGSTVTFDGSNFNDNISIPAGESFYNLTINAPSSVYTLSSAITVANDLTISDGSLDVSGSNYAVTVTGDWTVTAGTFVSRAGTVTFNASSGTQVITGGQFYNLTTSGGGGSTKQLASNLDVNGAVTIGDNTFLDGQTYDLYVGSSIGSGASVWIDNTATSGGFLSSGAQRVIFDGGTKTFDTGTAPTTFNNITFALNTGTTATFSATNATQINGNVVINSGPITVNLANASINFAGTNDLTINGTSNLIISVTNLPASLETFTLSSSSTVTYQSNSNQNIFPTTYGNLTIDQPAAAPGNDVDKVLLGNTTVLGTLDLDNDANTKLLIQDYTLTISGALAVATPTIGGTQQIEFDLATPATYSTIAFDGTAAQAVDAQLLSVENISFTGASTKTLGTGLGTLAVTNNLTVSSGATLTLAAEAISGTGTGSFSLGAGTTMNTAVSGNSFPQGFGTYSLAPTSTVNYNSNIANQTIESGVTYGNLTLDNGQTNAVTKTAEGNLNIDGVFTMQNDAVFIAGTFTHNIAGNFEYNWADASGFVAGTSTLVFDGAAQSFNLFGGNAGAITLNNLTVSNSGTLSLGISGGADAFTINGDFSVSPGGIVSLVNARTITFNGLNWTNSGTFTITGNAALVTFARDVIAETQTINPGVTNTFGDVTFIGESNKTITGNGFDINDQILLDDANGNFTLDMGTLTHTISGVSPGLGVPPITIDPGVTWTTSSASFILDGVSTYTLPAVFTTIQDLTISGGGTKTLSAALNVDDVTISAGAFATGGFGVTVTGNWLNSATFTAAGATVAFESNNGTGKSITAGASSFAAVTFNQVQTNTRTYTLGSNLTLTGALTVGQNATIDLNSYTATLGNGTTNSLASGAVLEIDADAILRFNNTASNSTLNINSGATLRAVGTGTNDRASISRSAGTNRTAINIANGATIAARWYSFEYLADAGLVINSTSTIDGTNNLSDGIWSNISATAGARYLQLDYDGGPITINNIQFNYAGTPPGGIYNVSRAVSSTNAVNFTGTVDGNLAGLNVTSNSTYENDNSNSMSWPATTALVWTGTTSTDWFTASNWNLGSVPDATTDVTIPNVTNDPVINGADAAAKSLTISDGVLSIGGGYDITVEQDVIIGSTGAGTLDAFGSSGTVISVGGNWTRGATGVFIPGGGTVDFTGTSGTKTIDNRSSSFDNITFSGNSTFNLGATGGTIDINGTLTIDATATVTMTTNGYNLTHSGNLVNNGTFNPTSTGVVGTVTLDGTGAQSISNGNYYNLTVSGSGTKSTTTSTVVANALTVNSTLSAGGDFDINGAVTIGASGTFADGGFSHTVAGAWTNNNASSGYTGTGTVTLDGAGVNISASDFANLVMAGTGTKTLIGNLDLTGSLTMNATLTAVNLQTFTIAGDGGDPFVSNSPILYVRGTNNFPSGFSNYTFASNAQTIYDGNLDQTVRGDINYGPIQFTGSGRTKTLDNPINVTGNLTINSGCILDVSAGNHSISLTGNWTNTTGIFVERSGEVIFNGSTADQVINSGTTISSDNNFYKVTVNNTGDYQIYPNNTSGLVTSNNLNVVAGRFNPNGLTINVGGSLTASGTGSFTSSSTITLNGTAGTYDISMNIANVPASLINNLTINASGATYNVLDDISIANNFNLLAGTFNGNGNSITLGGVGGGAKTVNIQGNFTLGAGGILLLGNAATLSVGSGATLDLVGTAGNPTTVSRNGAGNYSFQVNNGTIAARYTTFEYMNANGIYVTTSASVHATNNFSNCTFTNGTAGGVLLRLEHSTTGFTISDISFPTNPGGGAFNVQRTIATSGVIVFDPSTGAFTGESFDNDPSSLLSWPTPITLTWDGSTSTDWYTATNWTPSSGGEIIPDATTDVVIVTATNAPSITASGALAKSLTVNSGTLTINTTDDGTADDLTIAADLVINGGSIVVSANDDIIAIAGGFTRNTGGSFNNGSSTVRFNGTSGTKTINNGSSAFYNLEIGGTAAYQIGANTTISNNLSILSGSSFDVTGTNYNLTIGGDFTNAGTFNSRTATILFNASSGTKTLTSGGASLNNVTITLTGGAILQLSGTLSTKANTTINSGTLDLNGQTFNHGDGVGTDALSVSGTLEVDGLASLRMGNASTLTVNSGGIMSVVGPDAANIATMTRQTVGTYAVTISSGGTFGARYYLIEHLNASGIVFSAGSNLNGTNFFQEGSFANGAAGGTYVNFQNTLTGPTATNVVFGSGPTNNITRPNGLTGTITFQDASGSLAGQDYESDPGAQINWTSTFSTYTWDGSSSTVWEVAANWDSNVVPGTGVNVIIPSGTPNAPTISATAATVRDLTINSGATLTLAAGQTLTVERDVTITGTLTSTGSASTINVAGNWTRTGTFNAGLSTIVMNPSSGTKTFANGATSIRNLTINGAVGTTVLLSSNITVSGNLTLQSGTFDVTASNYQVSVGGNYTNSGGTLNARSGTFVFNGTIDQDLNAGGLTSSQRFYNLTVSKLSGDLDLVSTNIRVVNQLNLTTGTFHANAQDIYVNGNWANTGGTFNAGTGTVYFVSSGTVNLNANTSTNTFNNVDISKSSGGQVTLLSNINVNGNLVVTSGTLFANGKTINFGDAAADNFTIASGATMNVDGGSFLNLYGGTTNNVNGTFQLVGSSASNRATISRRTTGNYTVNFNNGSTGRFQFATVDQTGGNGLIFNTGSTIDPAYNFATTTFQNGTGTAYVTLNSNQSVTLTGTTFQTGPTYNAQTTSGSGAFVFNNYKGTMGGARFENDVAGSLGRGRIRWTFTETQAIGANGSYTFGNDLILNFVDRGSVTSATVQLVDDFHDPIKNQTMIRHYIVNATGTATTLTVRQHYGVHDQNGQTVDATLNFWRATGSGSPYTYYGPYGNTAFDADPADRYAELAFDGVSGRPTPASLNGIWFLSNADTESSLPVELGKTELVTKRGGVEILWETESETNNAMWRIERSISMPGVEEEYASVTTVEGKGTSSSKSIYKYTDKMVTVGLTYKYRLVSIDYDGSEYSFDLESIAYEAPKDFELGYNYPNPFNPTTTIPLDVPREQKVTIIVYNVMGQEVKTLVNDVLKPGFHDIRWDGKNGSGVQVASGQYFVRVDRKSVV